MTAGIFALVGVIVGGLLTLVVDLEVERRKRNALIFQAKRLVAEELSTIAIHLDGFLEHRTAPLAGETRRARLMPTVEWEANKTTLAQEGALDDGVWRELAHTMRAVGSLRFMILEVQPQSPLPANLMEGIADQRALVEHLHESLAGEPVDPVLDGQAGADLEADLGRDESTVADDRGEARGE